MMLYNRAALAAVANVFANPFRALLGKPTITFEAPAAAGSSLSALDRVITLPTSAMPRALAGARIRMDASDPKALIEQINAAVKEMRETQDQRLEKIEAKVDPLDLQKWDRIESSVGELETALDKINASIAANALNGGNTGRADPFADGDYLKLFAGFMRDGSNEQEAKVKTQQKMGVRAAMSEGSAADGGLLAPVEWDRTITERLKLISPMRQEASVQSISKAGFTKLFTDRQLGSGWVGEVASRPATSTPQFTALSFTPGEIYANAAASQDLLDDAEVDLENWLPSEIDTEFSRQEGIAFIAGDGTNKPFGFLQYVTGAAQAARHPWGDIKLLNSLNANLITTDGVLDLIYALPAMYTPNAKFFMNRKSLRGVRKLKDGQGNYIWQPTFVAGQPSTLVGHSIVDMPDMPDIAAGANPVAFGDMKETYLIVDRVGFRMLRDPYTNKPYISFYCTKRVGGGVKNPDAMKVMTISVTANP